jgi:hypothetical protein
MVWTGKPICYRTVGFELAKACQVGVLFIHHFFDWYVYANDRDAIYILPVLTS